MAVINIERQNIMKAVATSMYILLAMSATVVAVVFELWDILEPLMAFIALFFGVQTYISTKVLRVKKFQDTDNGDAIYNIVVSIGDLPIVEAVNHQFGNVDLVVSKAKLTTSESYLEVVQQVYDACRKNQHKQIQLFTSGSVGLNVLIGQKLQSNLFAISVFQYDAQTRKYFELPKV